MLTRRAISFAFLVATAITLGTVLFVADARPTEDVVAQTATPTPTPQAALAAAGRMPLTTGSQQLQPTPTSPPFATPAVVPSVPLCDGGPVYARQGSVGDGVAYSCDLINWTGPVMVRRGGE